MRRLILAVAALALVLPAATQAQAWNGWWRSMETDWHRNNCWPEPFQAMDRAAVQAPFAVMVANGWQRQHTIDGHHFDPETNELTDQGRQKLYWILTQAPEERRTVFVLGSIDGDITRTRLDSVQQATARVVRQGPLPQVLVTNIDPQGASAARVHAMNQAAHESRPVPILPTMEAAGGSSQ